ncbi:glycosyltransferase family A protein [Paenibacillus sp. HB172176]|uniref:glycosyltransferase n=1 Tax=Paenibacillus sp. HB172176 TaxID=2493690 RepID=UPI00143C6E41|nr:glycosyltransferase family A protein [Paenibacillus sp. HB172176]
MLAVVFAFLCLCGFVLFRNNSLEISEATDAMPARRPPTVTVLIPARNEEANLPHLLHSLRLQTLEPLEVIVIDDCSEDRTREIAESFGATVVEGSPPPPEWTGKNWAIWTGYAYSKGEVLVFLDADIRLAPQALSSLLHARKRTGGVISVVPFHTAEKLYEKLAMITNLLGVFAFTSPFERSNPRKGLYGACIVASREDYDRVNGHAGIRSEVLDDLFLGSAFMDAGIPVNNYLGAGLVSFRMYPHGIRSELEGFSKGAVLSTATLSPWTILPTALWTIGLLASCAMPFFIGSSYAWPLLFGYLLYMLQITYFNRRSGAFGLLMPALHMLSSLFFVLIMLLSLYQVVVLRKVVWKGRQIEVKGRARP